MNRSREEFIAKYLDEMYGWHLASMSLVQMDDARPNSLSWANLGVFARKAMSRAKELLGRQWDEDNDLAPRPPVPIKPAAPVNGNGQQPQRQAV